jgi:cytochrome c556
MLRAMVVVGGLAALTACATTPKMTTDEAIEKRKALMKEQGAAWRAVQDKAKAGQIAAIAPDAEKLAATSKQIPALFPEGSGDPAKSAAKPEIWQKRAEFAAAAKANDTAATQALVKDYGRLACGSCHQPFRVPPKQ